MCWESTISRKFLLSEETISKLIVIIFKQDSVLAFLRGSHRFLFFIFLIAPHIFCDVRQSFLLCFMYWILSSKSTRGQWPILWSSVLQYLWGHCSSCKHRAAKQREMHTEHFWKGHTQKKRAWLGQRALWPKQRNDHIGAFAVCAFAEVNTAFGSQKLFWESGRLYQQDLQKWKRISSAVWRAHSVLKTVKDKWLTSTVN